MDTLVSLRSSVIGRQEQHEEEDDQSLIQQAVVSHLAVLLHNHTNIQVNGSVASQSRYLPSSDQAISKHNPLLCNLRRPSVRFDERLRSLLL